MKIIKPSKEFTKPDGSTVVSIENEGERAISNTTGAENKVRGTKSLARKKPFAHPQALGEEERSANNSRQPLNKLNAERKQKKRRTKKKSSDFGFGTNRAYEEFDFDTSKLEAMPSEDELAIAIPKGKKRRRSELASEKAMNTESLQLSNDPAKQEYNELLARGMRLLAIREHSVKEITQKLFGKSEDASAIQTVIDELIENKYLCDQRFTESYIRSRANKGFGPVKIRAELKNKGVSSILIQDYLREGAASWFDSAKTQYIKKFGSNAVEDYPGWTKRARFLQGRGFNMEQIHSSVPPIDLD